ncbi:uncharacterized protein TNCV_2931 [Trichonephila clavipes]|nr:uncharacterized protein TNCV_2931 [Trichonephila clavipes]
MIDLITTYYGNAIRQNKTCLSDMRKAVWAVYFHIRSSDEEPLHSFCPVGPNSWCKYQNQVVEGSVETFRHSNKLPVTVMDAIKPVFNDLSQPKLLQKCLGKPKYTVAQVILKWKRRGSETAEKRTDKPKILGERRRRALKRTVKQNRKSS